MLYDFLRNEAFNARNYFDQTGHAPLYRRNDFGGTIGGPVTIPGLYNSKRDKTFFFFSEEFRLEKSPSDYNQAVPSLKERGMVITATFAAQYDPTPGFEICFTDLRSHSETGIASAFTVALISGLSVGVPESGVPPRPLFGFPDH